MANKLPSEEPEKASLPEVSALSIGAYSPEDAGFYHLRVCSDPVMASLAECLGPPDPARRRRGRPKDAHGALICSIVGQQLSTKAARTIYERLTELFGGRAPSPAEVLATGDEELRAVGISGRKIEYLRDLAHRVQSGELDLDSLHQLTDEEVVSRLVAVRGLGQWTADMFLIFHLNRPDVLPVGDLGIRRAVEKAYNLQDVPEPAKLRTLAEPWRPHRTLASLYLWESLDTEPLKGKSERTAKVDADK